MQLRKSKGWLFGVLAGAALMLAIVQLRRGPREVEVRLMTRQLDPLTYVTVTVTEEYRVPVLSWISFLPASLRKWTASRTFLSADGRIRIKRITGPGVLTRQELGFHQSGRRDSPDLVYTAAGMTQYDFIQGSSVKPWLPIKPIKMPSEGPVIVEIDDRQ